MIRMQTCTSLLILSALVASSCSYAAPSPHYDTGGGTSDAPSADSYAGAPADGAYASEGGDAGGWASDASVYDTAVGSFPLLE